MGNLRYSVFEPYRGLIYLIWMPNMVEMITVWVKSTRLGLLNGKSQITSEPDGKIIPLEDEGK